MSTEPHHSEDAGQTAWNETLRNLPPAAIYMSAQKAEEELQNYAAETAEAAAPLLRMGNNALTAQLVAHAKPSLSPEEGKVRTTSLNKAKWMVRNMLSDLFVLQKRR